MSAESRALFKKMLMDTPIMTRGSYLQTQQSACLTKGTAIIAMLDECISRDEDGGIRVSATFQTIHSEFWFWVLGAYEVSRNISMLRAGFPAELHKLIEGNLTYFTSIRVPFAKLQYAGVKLRAQIASGNYLSVSSIQADPPEMVFKIDVGAHQRYGIRSSIDRFEKFNEEVNNSLRRDIEANWEVYLEALVEDDEVAEEQ
ncbi:hypothetical protein [Phyllobacterium zundukense]|uniref:Uncharacterized protein n=1 Tax=Phyllobacterium zundukense TaxID=1867719 RepID=A0ACD4D4A3_9HYPH|nr:hypothetical protein [Phyllobacterium zundukense]UXN60713.1 hypothetical protein N8E88_30265 [Phyllobacterium zundukense]